MKQLATLLDLITLVRIDEIFTAMSQQMFLITLFSVVATAGSHRIDLTRVNVHAVLTLFGETDLESDQVIGHEMRGVFS